MNGCQRMVKSLENAERLRDIVGLRPGRDQVRLEMLHGTNGKSTDMDGGCGVTLSWGCGQEVLEKTVEVMKGMSNCKFEISFCMKNNFEITVKI
ncbi:hypothetical protein PVAND_013017 [Polypedilum vanderplanki]|uniref:Uncharacterized protein n=1 Tax=Polypedilum vanderplanki TaxID=319348 RepID=A0A9J6CP67_POLVA|nr:hypothetical protein PVAND_013017 [Polypedilum vanderplanki]